MMARFEAHETGMDAVTEWRTAPWNRWLFTLLCLLIPTGLAVAEEAVSPDGTLDTLRRDLQAELDERRQDMRERPEMLPGATAALVLADGRSVRIATGVADIEDGTRMPLDARMPTGSIGKTFVAAVALSLTGDGTLELDAPISRWLGDEPWFDRLPNHSGITVRHLLNHSSGLPDHVFAPDSGFRQYVESWLGRSGGVSPFDPRELVELVLDREPLFPPGQGFHYSDTAYILMGLVIEAASGERYYTLLTDRFLDPLDLDATEPLDKRVYAGLVPGYAPEASRLFGFPDKIASGGRFAFDPSLEWTGGGLLSDSMDLARWFHALFEGHALRQSAVHEMLSSVVRVPESGDTGTPAHYGLGIAIVETPFGKAYRHGGFFPGYNSMAAYFPRFRLALAMQINSDDAGIEAHFDAMIRTVVETLPAHSTGRTVERVSDD